jgi:hypothetical protein
VRYGGGGVVKLGVVGGGDDSGRIRSVGGCGRRQCKATRGQLVVDGAEGVDDTGGKEGYGLE